jgi:hypothetical protein
MQSLLDSLSDKVWLVYLLEDYGYGNGTLFMEFAEMVCGFGDQGLIHQNGF